MRSVSSAVKQLAVARGLPLHQPQRLSPDDIERLREARADALVVAAYGLLLPRAALEAAVRGAWNIHASLLPRWRGAAPIQRALLAGDAETGVSIMQMEVGLDTGPVLAQRRVPIGDEDDAGTLHDKLAALGAEMMLAALAELAVGQPRAIPQPATGATYARKIQKQDTLLEWARPAPELERAVRAFNPSPGAGTLLEGESLKVWRARLAAASGAPGTVLKADGELIVACGEHALQILELQRPGGKRLDAAQFLRGRALQPGTRFG
jgi:methionyl-tRNA formyltransferase